MQVFQRIAKPFRVALRKESVDRNVFLTLTVRNVPVALRKESVDRNNVSTNYHVRIRESLSARRAWIEICLTRNAHALREGRSPQGERG